MSYSTDTMGSSLASGVKVNSSHTFANFISVIFILHAEPLGTELLDLSAFPVNCKIVMASTQETPRRKPNC